MGGDEIQSGAAQRAMASSQARSDRARADSLHRRTRSAEESPGPSLGSKTARALNRGRTTHARACHECGEPFSGQFVRALAGTYHLDCFRCLDCSVIVATKFFPIDITTDSGHRQQYPLCERDYFKRLDLLCEACGGALRGSYITALEKKYHVEHFSCSVCPTVFGPQDSYYEHDGRVFCHFHYSSQFAAKCNGCHTAILKQFVEIFRNGEDQHWHPECYMIHKFWNVRLAAADEDEAQYNSVEPEQMLERERGTESKVYAIWSVLSAFEESSAACISDMLLHASNGAYSEGLMTAEKFIGHVTLLFDGLYELELAQAPAGAKPIQITREAKMLCKKVVAFFALIGKTQDTGVRKLGITQELLSLVTGLAHYLKLLIRIGLSYALQLEKQHDQGRGLKSFLDVLRLLYRIDEGKASGSRTVGDLQGPPVDLSSDLCAQCRGSIEDDCFQLDTRRWHLSCLKCSKCNSALKPSAPPVWNSKKNRIYHPSCGDGARLLYVPKLRQYVFLLRVALARLMNMLKENGLSHTTDDPNLAKYDSSQGHKSDDRPSLGSSIRSKSFAGETTDSYNNTLNDIRRLRSSRLDQKLANSAKQARQSRLIDEADASLTGQTTQEHQSDDANRQVGNILENIPARSFNVDDLNESRSDENQQHLTIGNHTLTLDDISRIVATEQAKEQRPNAYKHQKNFSRPSTATPRLINGHQHSLNKGSREPAQRQKRYLSELSALEHFIVSHIAVLSLERLVEPHFNLERLLGLIETRKTTFWGRLGMKPKKGGSVGEKKDRKKKGVFGVPLETLVERSGADSSLGVGPGRLRVPSFIDEIVSAMRQMDMSVEGVFRKNGNIKRLRELTEAIDKSPDGVTSFENENPVQLAALLKKFFREMPDSLMTFKLYRLWITSQKIEDEDVRRRVLHLTCCLLPKQHRDILEILLYFLNWAASFSHVDEELGSKMDTHNLATVITPNILYSKDGDGVDESFLAIEAVNSLLTYSEEFCEVPEDLLQILQDNSFFVNNAEITTKEILKRCEEILKQPTPERKSQVTKAGGGTNGNGNGNGKGNSSSQKSHFSKAPDQNPQIRVDAAIGGQSYVESQEATVRHVNSPISPMFGLHSAPASPLPSPVAPSFNQAIGQNR